MALPESVFLCEVGPRDGFQYEARLIPTDLKVEIIAGLISAGLRRLQVASFVHPAKVPQMADAEEVVSRLLPAPDGVVLAGLALNERGVQRAAASGLTHVDLSIATHDRHSLDNAGMTVEEAVREAGRMIALARNQNMQVQLGLQTVFGFRQPGDTPLEHTTALCRRFADLGVDELSLADTTGLANPMLVRSVVEAVRDTVGDVPIVLHLHDTRGLGLANVVAGLEAGIDRFDTSLGGMGGCPFIQGAAGNVATEDTLYLLESLGVTTGPDRLAVAAQSRRLEAFLDTRFAGKLHRLLSDTAAPA